MRQTALAALARFASPKSSTTMIEAAERRGVPLRPGQRHRRAAGVRAGSSAAKGDLATAEKLCRQIMKKTDEPSGCPRGPRRSAILADVRGPAALPDLLAAVDHAGPRVPQGGAAVGRADRAASPPSGSGRRRPRRSDAERRAEIVAMLGRQGDPRALPFIRASLAAREPEVMLAAAEALAHMERARRDAGPAGAAEDGHRRRGARRLAASCSGRLDEAHLDPLAAMLDTLPPPAKAAAIGVIGAKGGQALRRAHPRR